MRLVSWNYCKDPNDINKAIREHDPNWEGLVAENIISISWDAHLGCYVIFWHYENKTS